MFDLVEWVLYNVLGCIFIMFGVVVAQGWKMLVDDVVCFVCMFVEFCYFDFVFDVFRFFFVGVSCVIVFCIIVFGDLDFVFFVFMWDKLRVFVNMFWVCLFFCGYVFMWDNLEWVSQVILWGM